MKTKKQSKKSAPKAAEKSFKPKYLWVAAALVLMVTLIAYFPTLNNKFTNWDDPVYVTENEGIRNLSGDHLKAIFTEPVSLNYHPLTMFSLAVNYSISEAKPFGYHLTNLMLHLLNTFLVFLFIQGLTKGNWMVAALTALLFGVHPMHVESVSWISERKDVLYAAFYLGALVFYQRYIDKQQWSSYVIVLVLFLLSSLSKAVAVTLPVVLLLMDYYTGRKLSWKWLWEKTPLFILSIIFGITALNIQAEGAIAEFEVFTIFQRIMFGSYGILMYLEKLFWPMRLSAFYPYPNLDDLGNLPLIFYIAPWLVLLLLAAMVWSFKKTKVAIMGGMFFLVTIALVLQIISVGRAIMADRYTYLPYIGLFFMMAMGVDHLRKQPAPKLKSLGNTLLALMFGAALFLAFLTSQRTGVWKNSETLWTDVINKFPNRVEVSYKNRGNYYGKRGDANSALVDYQVLVAMQTEDPKVYSNLGNIYGLKEHYDKALESYTTGIKMDSANWDAYVNRGITYSKIGQYYTALQDFETAIELQPNNLKGHSFKAFTYNQLKQWDNAIAAYNELIKKRPNDLESYFQRGLAYFNLQQWDAAQQDYLKTIISLKMPHIICFFFACFSS